jgi:hypothetical protein
MFVVGDWGYMLFLAAADLVMILRVYAMWDQSKIILGILLLFYVPQIIVSVFWEVMYNNPNRTLSVTVVQVLNFRYCSYSSTTTPSATYRGIPRFVLGTALLILAVIPTFKQSIEMYKLTKRWQTNRSMELLLREGAVYFVVCVSLVPLCHICVHRSHFLSPQKNPPKKKLTTWTPSPELGMCFSILLMQSIYRSST